MTRPESQRATARLDTTVLLIGPGWLGQVVAAQLAALGATVAVLQRTPRASSSDILALTGDIASAARGPEQLAALQSVVQTALPGPIGHLVVCIAPSRTRGDDHGIYSQAAAGVAVLARALRIRSVLYVSSTGVYDRHDGSEVTEQSSIVPRDTRGQALYDAEQRIAAVADDDDVTVHIVRAAGLYGPQRDPAARLADPALAAGNVWCNFAWRDDVVSAITHLLMHDRAPGVRVFNCADGTPLRSSAIAATLAGRAMDSLMDSSMDSSMDATEHTVIDRVAPLRRGRSNQRINVNALKATGWRPIAPSVYDGLRLLGHQVPPAPGTT